MVLTRREVEILDYLVDGRRTTGEIAGALRFKHSNLSNYIKRLEHLKLTVRSKEPPDKFIVLDRYVRLYFWAAQRHLPLLKLVDVLIGKTLFLLNFIRSHETFRLRELGLPVATAKRLLKKLRSVGIIFMPKKGIYSRRRGLAELWVFCHLVLDKLLVESASLELAGVKTVYRDFHSANEIQCVFVTSQENSSKNYWPTAYSAFHNYGVKLISADKYYYSNSKPKLENVVIHSLVVSKDERGIAYACALMVKNKFNPRKLLKVKQRFHLSRKFLYDLIEFMESKGKAREFKFFPSWSEVEEIVNG